MDEVQAFIARNKHQLAYIMQEASQQWAAVDPVGALTVGPCVKQVEVYGEYLHLADANKQMREGLEWIKYDAPLRCSDRAAAALKEYYTQHYMCLVANPRISEDSGPMNARNLESTTLLICCTRKNVTEPTTVIMLRMYSKGHVEQ